MIIKAFAADSDKPSIGCFNNHGKRSSLSLSLSLCLSVSPPSLAPTSMFTSHTDLMLSLCQGLTYDQTVVVYRLGKVCKWPARCSRLLSSRRKRTNERTNWECVISSLNIRGTGEFLACANYVSSYVSIARWHVSVWKPSSRRGQPFRTVPSQFSNYE